MQPAERQRVLNYVVTLVPEEDTLRFELDLEASQSPFLRKYQQSIKRREKKPRRLII